MIPVTALEAFKTECARTLGELDSLAARGGRT